jgi:hypothetical protein
MVVTHGGWLSIELNGRQFANGQIVKQIYLHEDDVASSSINNCKTTMTGIFFLLFVHSIFLYFK